MSNSPSLRTRKNRGKLRVSFLSALAKRFKKPIFKEPWEKLSTTKDRIRFLAEEDFDFDGQLRCPNCNKLLAKIKCGHILNLLDNTNPPIIELKCQRGYCKAISRHSILKEKISPNRRRIKIRQITNEK